MTPAESKFDLIVTGGGPAGTSAAIAAARRGVRVLLLERGRFPRHKVCGEFISPESLELLRSLLTTSAAQRVLADAPLIRRARVFIGKQKLEAAISPPAASIARYALDELLWKAAQESGAICREQVEVGAVHRGDGFTVETGAGSFTARAIINASGRWSKLQSSLTSKAALIGAKSGKPRWLGIKAHYRERSAEAKVKRDAASTDLYIFPGGYCGVQPVLGDDGAQRLNVCAMCRADVATTLEQVTQMHPELAQRARDCTPAMEPVTTSPLIFREPKPVADGMMQVGDAAGFIDPFVGDGIAIALRGGSMAGDLMGRVATGTLTVDEACEEYGDRYRSSFLPAFRNARRLRRLMELPGVLRAPVLQALRLPGAAEFVVRKTRSLSVE
jgi:flavin-dependent dehydrogenase